MSKNKKTTKTKQTNTFLQITIGIYNMGHNDKSNQTEHFFIFLLEFPTDMTCYWHDIGNSLFIMPGNTYIREQKYAYLL